MIALLGENWGPILTLISIGAIIFTLGHWFGKINSDRKRFEEFAKEIRENIKIILGRLPG